MTDPGTDVLPAALRRRLEAQYATPPRHYHTLEHAAAVARRVAALGGDRACVLAAWFHDAIYDPTAADNEQRSAELLLDWLPADPDAPEAARLIGCTATHDPPSDDRQALILCDADLATLGAAPQAYEAYRQAVRREYAHIDDAGWRTGRRTVLERLLSRPRIYRTRDAHDRWESAARRNLATELDTLR